MEILETGWPKPGLAMSKSRRFEDCGNWTLDCRVAPHFREATSVLCQ